MENNCELVSSRGLLKSCSIRHPNPQTAEVNLHEYLENMNQHENMSIYVNSHSLATFVDVYLSRIHCKFFLVSGDSDLGVPEEVLNEQQLQNLLSNPYLIKWFAQNLLAKATDKLCHLPIGLDYHTILQDPSHWWRMECDNEGYLPGEQEILLKSIRDKSKPFYERSKKIFCNVHFRPDRYKQRECAVAAIPEELMDKANQHLARSQTWNRKAQNTFVLSPFGNGYDCHRTWEALCLGCIPIMKVPEFSELFEGLPVINVEEWSDITSEFLEKRVEELKSTSVNMEKLTLAYWVKQFRP